MKKIKLDEETTKKFKEALDVFMVNPKKGNAMLDQIHDEQSYHNTDIAACGHATCPSRESCLRWVLGQRMEEYQCFGEFKPRDGKCAYYLETTERTDNDNDNEND